MASSYGAAVPKQRAGRKPRRHSGVKVLALGRGGHVARWLDPITGKSREQSLDRLGLTSDATRREWARRKAEQLAQLRQQVALGAVQLQREAPAAVVSTYLATFDNAGTKDNKRIVLDELVDWLTERGIRSMPDLTGPLVMAWRDHLLAPRRAHAPSTRNRWLVASAIFLRWARKRGHLPLVTLEAIKDGTERVPEPIEEIEFLRPPAIRKLLEAALAHDASPTDYRRPAAPFALALLLSGMRFAEAAQLSWHEVNVEGSGEIKLAASRTKTKRARIIAMAETPFLLRLLKALRDCAEEGAQRVWDWPSQSSWATVCKRLHEAYGAPRFTSHLLRRTCGTVLTNAPGIYGGASAWHSAKRLGHSVEQAERDYAGQLPGLPADARTLEAAAGCEDLCECIVRQVEGG